MKNSLYKSDQRVLILNLNRHYDLLNLAEYVERQINLQSSKSSAKVLVSQRKYDGVRVNHIFANTIGGLLKILYTERPSWIYITGPSRLAFIALFVQKILLRKNTITHLHRFDYHSYTKVRGLALRLYNALVTRISDFCIVHSESVASRHKKYIYAPLPFHIKRLGTNKRRKETGLNILFFGRIDRNKGLVRVQKLAKLMPKANFFVFGEIVDESQNRIIEDLRDFANCSVSSERVLEAEIPRIFEGKDVIILPYFDGTQSGIPNLSAVYGVPVLSTPFGEISVTIDANRCGIYHEYCEKKWPEILTSTNWALLSEQICIDTNSVDKSYAQIFENSIDHC